MRDGDKPLNTELSPFVTICSPFLRGHDDGVVDYVIDCTVVSLSTFNQPLGWGVMPKKLVPEKPFCETRLCPAID